MNQTSVSLLFDIALKKCDSLLAEAIKQGVKDYCDFFKVHAGEVLRQELRLINAAYNKAAKSSQEGTTAIFIEGRPIYAALKSRIMECDYQEIAAYLTKLVTQVVQRKLNISMQDAEPIAEEFIIQLCLHLKDPMVTNFGPKPQWFEALNWYDKALSGYNEQIATLENVIPAFEGSKLRDGLRTQQQLVFQKISCLYHLGCYEEVLAEVYRYSQFVERTLNTDQERATSMLTKFNVVVAKYCVQSAIELQDKAGDVQQWLQHLDAGMSGQKLLIQSIHYVQKNELEKAERLVLELTDQIMSPIIAGTLESYERAYDNIVTLQQAVELQEVIRFKQKTGIVG